MNEIRYFSMFTGVGGFELGLGNKQSAEKLKDWQGRNRNTHEGERDVCRANISTFRCVGFSEIDTYGSKLLSQRFPDTPNFGDCTKINPSELPDFDMLCGGFPCQAFSIAGKRRGFEDTRGTMFFEVARILEAKRPKLVFLENVKGLLNHNKGETFKVILQTLEELGYRTQWMVLNSKFFGVPQNRERVFIIGSLRGESRPEILPFREISEILNEKNEGEFWEKRICSTIDSRYGSLRSSGETYMIDVYNKKLRDESPCLSEPHHNSIRVLHNIYGGFGEGIQESDISPTLRTPKGGGHLPMIAIPVLTSDREEKRQNGRRFKEDGEPSFTLTKTDIHGVMMIANSVTPDAYLASGQRKRDDNGKAILTSMHERRIRKLTPKECERLQGFPDNWTEGFSDTQRYKMMGNAVTVNVIRAIAEKLK